MSITPKHLTPVLTVPFSQSAGRTIAKVLYSKASPLAVVKFQDGAYAFIGIDRAYESSDDTLEDGDYDPGQLFDCELIELDIATQEQLDTAREQQRLEAAERARKHQEATQWEQYQRLKKIFEPES